MLARFALLSLLVLVAGCGPAPCGPSNCTGCCSNGACVDSTTSTCGTSGGQCVDCAATGRSCVSGACKAQCSPATCSGCCDGANTCHLMVSADFCGTGGGACTVCVNPMGCGPQGTCVPDPTLTCDGGATVTTAQLETVLSTRCVTGCHTPGPPAGTAIAYGDFTSAAKSQLMVGKTSVYADTSGALKIVDPRRPGNSTLWLKVSSPGALGLRGPGGEGTGAKMPSDGTTVTAGEQQMFKDWICSGAPP